MSTPTFGFKLEDVDDVVHAVPGRTRIAASNSLVALNYKDGFTIASSGMVKDDRYKYILAWSNAMPFIENPTMMLYNGAFNDVYKITEETAIKLQLTDERKDAVFRVSNKGAPVPFDDAVDEAALTLLAADLGIGPRIHSAVLMFSDLDKPGRMMLAMERAEGNLYDLSLMFKPGGFGDREAEVVTQQMYEACVELSNHSIFHLDLKLGNMLYTNGGASIYLIDFDPAYAFRVDVDPKAALLVNLVLIAMHVSIWFHDKGAAGVILRLLETPLLELYRQAKRGDFDGADILSIDMPKTTEYSFPDAYDKTQPDKVRLKRALPAMVHNYFLNKYCANAGTRKAAIWPYWQISDQHRRFPLVVQLLRFALWPRSYTEYKDLLTCEPQPW